MVRAELYRECTRQLEGCGIPDSAFDAMCIFEDMLHEKNPMFRPQEEVSPEAEELIRSMINERCTGRPLQYILGCWEFWGLPMKVGEGVLIPRPDTETLVEEVLRICRKNGWTAPKIADLCSGSGCIAIALAHELPDAEIYAAELSEQALFYLRQNSELNSAGLKIVKCDVLDEAEAEKFQGFDIIVSNPPYLTEAEMNDLQREVGAEPETALYGGRDGLDYYEKMTAVWKGSLKDGGFMCYEFGMGQHEAVGDILRKNGFGEIDLAKDAGGIIRTAAAKKWR